MNNTIKTWLYILGGFLVVGVLSFLAFQLLLWAIPIMLIVFVVLKIKGYLMGTNRGKNRYESNNQRYTSQDTSSYIQSDDEGEVIDVDYKDVQGK